MDTNNAPSITNYATPGDVMADASLSKAERCDLLIRWKSDLENRIEAEAEGMSSADPIASKHEAGIADTLQAVSNALIALDQSS